MKLPSALLFLIIATLPFMTSCSALRSGNPVPAGYDADKQGWVSKYIPGAKSVSNFIPPPSEARTNWDRWYDKRNDSWKTRGE
ncbi:MAG: hypothetical protein HY913_02325 [Desulfomonile tiedjei]|nr:hypothetical protein [Desulfomonile tiedjei]